MDLFAEEVSLQKQKNEPLALRMRPQTLDEFVGQQELIGAGRFLRRVIQSDSIPSLLFFGPPGTGKTTLANIVAHSTGAHFEEMNAVAAGVADIRKAVDKAKERLLRSNRRTILLLTRSTGLTSRSRMPCCMRSKTGSSCSSAPPPRTRSSR